MHLYQLKPKKNSSFLRKLIWQLRTNKTLIWTVILLISIWGILHIYSKKNNPYTMERESKFVLGLNSNKYTYNRDMPLIFIGGVPRLEITKLFKICTKNERNFVTDQVWLHIYFISWMVLKNYLKRNNSNESNVGCTSRSEMWPRNSCYPENK